MALGPFLPAFKNKQTQLMTVSMEMVCMAKSQPKKNQSEHLDLPQDYLAIPFEILLNDTMFI